MFKFRIAFIYLMTGIIGVLSYACSPHEPILPVDVAEKIKDNLGHALAPAWLPEGFEYGGPFLNSFESDPVFASQNITQAYYRVISSKETINLVLIYPVDDIAYSSTQGMLDLVPPEDAISEININDATGYLFHGGWSEDTLERIQGLDLPINPEWDYGGNISLQFVVDTVEYGKVWVLLRTVFPTDEISEKELIKIAKSVAVVE